MTPPTVRRSEALWSLDEGAGGRGEGEGSSVIVVVAVEDVVMMIEAWRKREEGFDGCECEVFDFGSAENEKLGISGTPKIA